MICSKCEILFLAQTAQTMKIHLSNKGELVANISHITYSTFAFKHHIYPHPTLLILLLPTDVSTNYVFIHCIHSVIR